MAEADLVVKTDVQISPPAGYKTTEFWVALFGNLIGGLLTTGVIANGTQGARLAGAAMIVLLGLGYTAGRSLVKKATLENIGPAAVMRAQYIRQQQHSVV